MAPFKFIDRVSRGVEIQQFGDGSSSRDYTYISDIVDGIRRSIERCEGYHIWNLGGSSTITLAELMAKIAAGLGVEPKVRQLESQPGDVDRTWADISLARRELDWAPELDIDRGLQRFLDWFKQQRAHGAESRDK